MKISVCIPTHDMQDKEFFLTRCLDSLWNQSFQDFEIIVSDNSEDNIIKDICDYYGSIKYEYNREKGMAQNSNHALRRAEGHLVKILYMDDYLAHNHALEDVWNSFQGAWLVTGCLHAGKDGETFNPHEPSYNDYIIKGNNTIGSPSVLTMLNDKKLFFDERMTWLLDCDLYKRLHDKYGEPVYLPYPNVVIGIGDHQMSRILTEAEKLSEQDLIK